MSLLYECINTVIAVLISISSGMPNHSASIQLCVQKLRILIEDSDQNCKLCTCAPKLITDIKILSHFAVKYLGLLAMSKILKTHPKSVQAHKDLILACLDDKDESIRLRALDLLYGMVSKKNLMEIVRRLLGHMERAEGSAYRDELLFKVIEICSQGSYQYVTNFEWYLTVLVELIQLEAGSKHGTTLILFIYLLTNIFVCRWCYCYAIVGRVHSSASRSCICRGRNDNAVAYVPGEQCRPNGHNV